MALKAWISITNEKSLLILGLISFVSLLLTYNSLFQHSQHDTRERIQEQKSVLKTLLALSSKATIKRGVRSTKYRTPKGYCEGVSSYNFNPDMFKHIIFNDKYKILYCQVPKVACTNWRRILLFLSGNMNSTDPMKIPAGEVHNEYDKHLSYLSDLTVEEIQYRIKHYFKFVFTREPFERVLSAYRNKFQKRNDFFHSRFGKNIVQGYRPTARGKRTTGNDVTFLEYVQYLTDNTRVEPLNEHWERMTHLCHPCIMNYDIVSSYDDLDENSDKVLRKIGVANKIQFPKRSVSYKHIGTDRLLRQYYSQIPPAFLNQLMEVYYPDFVMFHYNIPNSIRNLTRWQVAL